jgi:signal transduction histidine kinase/ActR/RegA family two-component response regulator
MRSALSTSLHTLSRSWVVWLWLLTMVPLLFSWLQPPGPIDAPGVRWLSAQRLWMNDVSGQVLADRAVNVSLPDSWKPAGLPAAGVGRYRLLVDITPQAVADARRQAWSMRIDHLHAVHTIWLNGELLHSTLPRPGWLGLPTPSLIDVPGRMLQAGANTLDIEIQAANQGGLSEAALGPKAGLQRDHFLMRVLTRDALIVLNLIWIAFSLFVVALWWMRRQEAAAGLFGLLVLVGGLRNCRYFITEDLGLSIGVESWLHFLAHVMTSCLQAWFVMALVGRHLPWLHRLLWAVLIGFPLVGLLALPHDPDLRQTRDALQGVLIMTLAPSIWLMVQWMQRQGVRSSMQAGLALGWAALLVAGLHDFIFGRMIGRIGFSYWMGWMIPLASSAFVLMVVQRIVQAFNDIEQARQQLEHKVAERTRELAAANAAKGHFLASASHDLRQPVAAIGLITDLLRTQVTDPAVRGLTDRLTRAVRSMESLLKGLLDLSRLDSGTVEVKRQRVRLQALLDAVVSHEAESALQKGLTLRVRNTEAIAWTDPVLLEQVLRNLVGNAIRHTRRGGVLVGVRRRSGPNQWAVQVWDTGPGIGSEDLPRIFEAFVQLGNPGRERAHGLGLGLAIVQRATELLGHPLQVRSRPGSGSCFAVSLPACSPDGLDTDVPVVAASAADERFERRRVLVVEDDEPLRESIVLWLSNWGLDAVAGPGLAWLKALPRQPWDLVISDHRLPDGSGREVVQHLRQAQPGLPGLIITGDTSAQQLAELAASGMPVLHKPFRAERLKAMLNDGLSPAESADRAISPGEPG